MKKIIALLGLLTAVGLVHAQNVTNLMPNGSFTNGGPTADWVEVSGGGTFAYSYPATGGNPDHFGIIDGTAAPGGWGIWVGGDATPIPLESLGLTAGNTYAFLQDMKVLAGTNIGGIKIESWGSSGIITNHGGDKRFSTVGKNINAWETYGINITLDPSATGIKVVPLWGPSSSVGFDNFRVVILASIPLTASIDAPLNQGLRSPNFTITASAMISPAAVTNMAFFDGGNLLGNITSPPYIWDVTGAAVGNHALTVVAKSSDGASFTSSVVNVSVVSSITVGLDSTKPWQGYMNVFETPQDPTAPSGFVFGSGWGTADLRAAFSGNTLTLRPNIINDPAPFWYVDTNSPSIGNKIMEANFYVEPAEFWANIPVTFSGKVVVSSLASSMNPTNNGWTILAVIKDFASDYSSSDVTSAPITANGDFSISYTPGPDTLRHLQYGFVVTGPCVWPTDPVLASYGSIVVVPTIPTAPRITASLSGGNVNLSFPTELGRTYTILRKMNLTDPSWTTLTTREGTGATVVVADPASGGGHYYRASVQ